MNQKIELRDIFRLFRTQLVATIIAGIFGIAVAGLYSYLTVKETYSMESTLIVAPKSDAAFQVQDLTIYEKMVGTYIDLGQSNVLKKMINEKLPKEAIASIKSVSIRSNSNSQMMYISFQGTDEVLLPNYVQVYLEVYHQLAEESLQNFSLNLLSTDTVPTTSVFKRYMFNVTVGFVLFSSTWLVGAVLIYLINDKVKTTQQLIELFELPLLGLIHRNDNLKHSKGSSTPDTIELIDNPLSTIAESYRMLRSSLDSIITEEGAKIIALTSSVPNEGKTTTSINLAISLAETGKKVLLIDGDLRKSSINKYLHLKKNPGLIELVKNQSVSRGFFQAVPLDTTHQLMVLTAGTGTNFPTEILESKNIEELLLILRDQFDVIIIDTPPLLAVADAQILARYADSVLLVSDIKNAKRSELQEVNRKLQTSFTNVVGLVATNIDSSSSTYYAYEY